MTEETRWNLIEASPDEPDVWRVCDRLRSLPDQVFTSKFFAEAWITARGPSVRGKQRSVFTFMGGTLTLNRDGFGHGNGDAYLATDGPPVFSVRLERSELEQLRDWLRRELPLVQPA